MKLGDIEITTLAPSFQHITNLKVLSFSSILLILFISSYIDNNISDFGLYSLSEYINFSSSLESLYLNGTFISINNV